MSDKTKKMLATFFYIGDFPVAPGSVASIAGVLIYLIFSQMPIVYILLIAGLTYLGFKVCVDIERILNQKDPSSVVIDEVAGVMIAFLFLPISIPVVVTAYFLFRAFDMFKIYPVNEFEKYEGAKGIMLDDIIAGIYTNIVMHISVKLAGIV